MSRAIVRCERSWSSQFWAARIAGTPMQTTVAAAAAVTLSAFGEPRDQVADGQHAEPDPDREGIERARIDVVAFARLAGRGVEIEDQRDAHHHEQPQHDREVALVAVQLVERVRSVPAGRGGNNRCCGPCFRRFRAAGCPAGRRISRRSSGCPRASCRR